MNAEQIAALDFGKGDGLLPVIVQDAVTARVLMLGYMNQEALRVTLDSGHVTFFSRSKQRLWTKGETSGHYLKLVKLAADCDQDTLLVLAHPHGPTCHTGTDSCFGELTAAATDIGFLSRLQQVIDERIQQQPEGSYTAKLWADGTRRMAQKVGEEGVEVALAAVAQSEQHLLSESADLLFHLSLLLKSRQLSLQQVVAELAGRHQAGR